MPDGMIQKERKKRIIKQTAMKAILVIILVCIAMITFFYSFKCGKSKYQEISILADRRLQTGCRMIIGLPILCM